VIVHPREGHRVSQRKGHHLPPVVERGSRPHVIKEIESPLLRDLPGFFWESFSLGDKFSTSVFSLKSAEEYFLKCCSYVFLPPCNISSGNERRNLGVNFFSISQPLKDSMHRQETFPFEGQQTVIILGGCILTSFLSIRF